ncbi:hypothetical protein GQ602_007223 [Ophiocordyceps camponoti-floridani]|uniref:Uncharacterized protein n=1 Tax=Ophiocordyceps camponoti-floridani TaxID=2030778 RepID=A0A8H4VAK1_9HYPO|nr:hypothetical protein GQ602_007223 [Ophiocordyceps camponoti-floridani]
MDSQGVQRARSNPALPLARRFDESSWYEVSSQPSSSSLSSVGDEIVTTGLHVGSPHNRRRRLHQPSVRVSEPPRSAAIEFDETESEEDRSLTSSGERTGKARAAVDSGDDDSDGGDDATALGRATDRPVFQPQPNAFSHPPSSVARRSQSTNGAGAPHPHSGFSRPSLYHRSQTRAHRNFMSPSSAREDNEAALRASLTTLLSCAAAARGLPKTREEAEQQRLAGNGIEPSNQPVELTLVPESELTGAAAPTQTGPQAAARGVPRTVLNQTPARMDGDRTKRGRSPRGTSKKKRAAAAAAAAEDSLVSPTLLTWVVSAGVVVLVSVVGFGAGYVMGREAGRHEALSASASGVNETTRCGRDVISSGGGLRRLRWGSAVGRRIVTQA